MVRGSHHTLESRRVISEKQRGMFAGESNPFFGKHHTPETVERMRVAHLGKKVVFTPEHRKKLSVARRGYHPPIEIRKKMSITHTGVKLSPEHRRKIRLGHLGPKGSNWRGGITPLIRKVRNHFNYRLWRSDVFKRDNFTCQECEQRGKYLHAHHLKRFQTIMNENSIKSIEEALACEELWNINNGVTLCVKCHNKIPRNEN